MSGIEAREPSGDGFFPYEKDVKVGEVSLESGQGGVDNEWTG